jgi:hypothetical protein
MRRPPSDDYVQEFVEELLRTGLLLVDLAAELIESLPEDAYPGESNAEVVLDMMTGTIRPAAEAAGESLVRGATALLDASGTRTLDDLERAVELAAVKEANGGEASDGQPGG